MSIRSTKYIFDWMRVWTQSVSCITAPDIDSFSSLLVGTCFNETYFQKKKHHKIIFFIEVHVMTALLIFVMYIKWWKKFFFPILFFCYLLVLVLYNMVVQVMDHNEWRFSTSQNPISIDSQYHFTLKYENIIIFFVIFQYRCVW